MRTDDDLGLTRLLDRAAGSDSLTQARELAELEQRLFSRTIEPVRLNRYVLLERLGSGGFGVVYLGYDPELDRRVAIKLLHGRKADDRSLDKAAPGGELLVEAQAMAKFSHPNVVAIHDVGSFDASERSHLHTLGPRGSADATGTFIVMELVDGVTLRQWLTEPRLPLEIIEVFVQAGQGLAAAHRAGLIHGDFKPDNVIVGHDRRVRVLDFGLAQARAVPGASAPQGAVITGTPAYMAPEQLDGASADASVDQYAFALALREALYGIDPRQRDSPLLGSPRKVESMRTKLLPRHARGIFTRALQVEPALRYPDMQALLDALTGQRRRRVERWVAAAGGLAIVIGLSSWVASPQRPDCSPDEQLEGIWDPATQQQLELQFGRSGAVDGAEIWKSVRSTLDDHAAQWSEAWSSTCEATADRSQPSAAVAGQLSCLERDLQRLGGLTQLLGEADVMMVQHANESAFALSSPQRCATAGAREPTVPRGPARSEVLAIEAEIVRANELGRSGRLSDAVNVAQAAVERAKATGAVATLAATLLAQGHAQRRAGDYRSATETLQQAVASAERAGAVDLVVRAAAELVRALSEQRRLDTAEGVLLMALTRIARGDAGDAEAAELYFQAGVLRMAQQRADESIDALEQGLVLATKVYGPDHPHTAALHNSLGNALKDAGRYDEALEQLEIGLATWTERLGPRHSSVALALNNIGNVRMRQGDPAEALTLYTRARDVGRSAYPPGHPDLAIFYGNLADARSTVGDSAAAIDSYTRAIDILRANDEKEGQTL
nr:serine/threonine-protein kinase [Deltaproteobacteria bacterium]